MAPSTASHVFISYSRKDDAAMRHIVEHLRSEGIKVWVDNEKLAPGTPIWEKEIEKAIKGASAAIVILSPDAKESVWVLNELTLVDEYKKRVFPILVRGDFRESVPFRLVTRQFVDLRNNERAGLISLSAALLFYLEELTRLEEEREAAEKAAREKAEAENIAKKEIEQKAKQIAEEESKANERADYLATQKTEAQRLVDEREAGHQEKEKAELFTAQREKEHRAKINLAAEQFLDEEERRKKARQEERNLSILSTNARFAFLHSAQKRVLIGSTIGFILWIFSTFTFDEGVSLSWAISTGGCALAGLIMYPHRTSLTLFAFSFLAWGIIGVATLGSRYSTGQTVFMFISIGIFYGLFTSAFISRVLVWLKVIN